MHELHEHLERSAAGLGPDPAAAAAAGGGSKDGKERRARLEREVEELSAQPAGRCRLAESLSSPPPIPPSPPLSIGTAG